MTEHVGLVSDDVGSVRVIIGIAIRGIRWALQDSCLDLRWTIQFPVGGLSVHLDIWMALYLACLQSLMLQIVILVTICHI